MQETLLQSDIFSWVSPPEASFGLKNPPEFLGLEAGEYVFVRLPRKRQLASKLHLRGQTQRHWTTQLPIWCYRQLVEKNNGSSSVG